MKNQRPYLAIATAALALAATARSEDKPAASGPPSPPAEMAQLKPFAGQWSCTGKMEATPFGPAHKSITRVIAHSDLGGFWISGRVTETKTAESPMPIAGMFHETWDPGNKQFLMLWVDNMGGWSQETSTGWNGDTIVFSGDGFGGGQKMGERDSFTRKSDGEFLHTMELNLNGQWTALGQETCRAVAARSAVK
ncbi:MAG TPA: DUF1579 family protein [Thermoanaerobaculaceae bacterium]|nr:DUF1579 family protein [Thermoanaerobaculaceae bacterium]